MANFGPLLQKGPGLVAAIWEIIQDLILFEGSGTEKLRGGGAKIKIDKGIT